MESTKSHVIVKGIPGKAFSAGGDLKILALRRMNEIKESYRCGLRSVQLVATYKKPYIPIIDGLALGGAACYSIAGRKYSIVTERASFGMPEAAVGYFTDSGASFLLPRLQNNVGMYMGLTGARIHGYDLKKIGLCAYFVESRKIEELEKNLQSCTTEEEIRKTIAKFSSVPSTETELDKILNEIDKTFDGDTCEEIVENLHLDGSDWAMDTVRTMNRASPTSLKVCHRLLSIGRNLTLEECLKLEFRIAIHHVMKSDLKEGVRAFLIDRDNCPKWNPKTLHEVQAEHVERFFQPLADGDELVFQTR